MNKCKYFDCGWCYAPDDVKTNATQSGCFEPEHCPYLKSQMTENKKSFFVYYLNKTGGLHDPRYLIEMIELLKEWLSDEIEYEYGNGDYDKGWNDALCTIKGKLR
jgi:hypothetical protein